MAGKCRDGGADRKWLTADEDERILSLSPKERGNQGYVAAGLGMGRVQPS